MLTATTGKLHPEARTNPVVLAIRGTNAPESVESSIDLAGDLLVFSILEEDYNPADWYSKCWVFNWRSGDELMVSCLLI